MCDFFISGSKPLVRRLKRGAVPSQFKWTSQPSETDMARADRSRKRIQLRYVTPPCNDLLLIDADTMEVGAHSEITDCSDPGYNQPKTMTVTSQTYQSGIISTRDCGSDPVATPMFTARAFRGDNDAIHFYTGLETFDKFEFVLSTLGPAAHCLTYMYGAIHQILVIDQFFLVLVKLRRYSTNFELSRLFSISESDVYNIFCTWIRFMSVQWREVSIWPDRDMVRFYAPQDFKAKFPSTRVIVDGTECPVQKPKLPHAQQATYSTYKNRNTVKVLVGITPGGLCSYLSPGYGGCTSDRQIIERSSMPQDCVPGDSIMADKGFDVQDIFAPYDVKINIPTFFKKKNRMSGKSVLADRKIASKRVHVERFIGLVKTYKILTNPMNTSETQLSSDITFVCCMLCNFRSCIVPHHA